MCKVQKNQLWYKDKQEIDVNTWSHANNLQTSLFTYQNGELEAMNDSLSYAYIHKHVTSETLHDSVWIISISKWFYTGSQPYIYIHPARHLLPAKSKKTKKKGKKTPLRCLADLFWLIYLLTSPRALSLMILHSHKMFRECFFWLSGRVSISLLIQILKDLYWFAFAQIPALKIWPSMLCCNSDSIWSSVVNGKHT